MKKVITFALFLLLVLGGVAGAWYWQNRAAARPAFRTAMVERGDLEAVISATGTLEPEEVIDVGAQVAGRIERFGKDPHDPTKTINYGSRVEDGTVLAELDPALYQSRRDGAKADLEKSKADLKQQEAKALQAERDMSRARELASRNVLSASEFDVAQAAHGTAQANILVSKAAIAQAEAALSEAETNLKYTVIRSPVKGVIIERRVNVGQTVVASLSAPSLFLIAKDLTKIEVWASVNEADIGQIKIGQPVRFNVDTHPGRVFEGKVVRQGDYPNRLNANMTQNVVTYTVVVSTDNSDGLLLPYLTANLQFVVSEKNDALLVPNAALRWRPQINQVAPEFRAAYAKGPQRRKLNGDKSAGEEGAVWVIDRNHVRPVRVRIGLSDGANTEILGGDLPEGTEIVVGELRQDNGNDASNPFTVQMFGGKKSP
jgi:HlyD family secretion protein